MKTFAAILIATVASAAAFAPAPSTGYKTALNKSIFDIVSDMDLFAPKADQNNYGARDKKDLKLGKIGDSSYIPSGLSAAQYQKLREAEKAKKDANYKRNVAKAGKFIDYTDFYLKRGTDVKADWKKSVTLGHEMAKTKYDWSGKTEVGKKLDQAVSAKAAKAASKKAAPKKKKFFGM